MRRWRLTIMTMALGLLVFQAMAGDPEVTVKVVGGSKRTYPPKDKFDMSAFRGDVDKHIATIKTHLKSVAALMKWRAIDAYAEVTTLKYFAEHPYIEEATNIRKSWYKKLAKALAPLAQAKTLAEVYGERNYTEKQAAAKKQCIAEAKKFIAVLKKPERIKRERQPAAKGRR